jgi:K+-sensing histidine kinase KdpD
LALVVETPADSGVSSETVRRIREHLDDATDLGAEIVTTEAADLVEGIVRIARARRVTRLVMPHRTSTALERVRKSPLTERILEQLPTLEVTVVADARGATDAFQVGRGD